MLMTTTKTLRTTLLLICAATVNLTTMAGENATQEGDKRLASHQGGTGTGPSYWNQRVIPLSLETIDDSQRLVIYVGINGGVALPYLFDTGSAGFNAAYYKGSYTGPKPNPAAWKATSTISKNAKVSYGTATKGLSYILNAVTVPSIQIYGKSDLTTPVVDLVAKDIYPQSKGFVIGQVTDQTFHSGKPSSFKSNLREGKPPLESGLYGTFGAGLFTGDNTSGSAPYVNASVLGQCTQTGWAVVANGGAGAAYAILGLMDAVRSQFTSSAPWTASGNDHPFPNSYAVGGTEFGGGQFAFTLTDPAGKNTPVSWTSGTLLDTGTPNNGLNYSGEQAALDPYETANPPQVDAGYAISVTGEAKGAGVYSFATTAGASPVTYDASIGAGQTTSTVGIGFFLRNSVAFDLENQQTLYTDSVVMAAPVAAPEFAPPNNAGGPNGSCVVSAGTPVAMTTSAGADIYFTTDGSVPSKVNGTKYSSPVPIHATTTLRAVAVLNGVQSDLASLTYSVYASPYDISPIFTQAQLGDDFAKRDKLNPSTMAKSKWSDLNQKYYTQNTIVGIAYGPPLAQFPAPSTKPTSLARTLDWRQQRLLYVARRYINTQYQHHHLPQWDPPQTWPIDPGNLVPSRHQTPGIDCSDFTAWVYNYALGIKMTSGILEQAALTSVEDASGAAIEIQKILSTGDFNSLVAQFQPGDLLYICKENSTTVSHVITWIGQVNGTGDYLVIDSHGENVTDSEGRMIPSGVQLRPFSDSPGNNTWYYTSFSHANRIVRQ